MKSEMTLLAVAGNGGALGAIGFSPAAALRWSMSKAASHPIPMPDDCRNLRREASIDIDKLAHVENQQAKPRQQTPPHKRQRRLPSAGRGRAIERQLPCGFNGRFGRVAGEPLN